MPAGRKSYIERLTDIPLPPLIDPEEISTPDPPGILFLLESFDERTEDEKTS